MKSSLEVNDFGSYHADGGIKVMEIVIRKEGEGGGEVKLNQCRKLSKARVYRPSTLHFINTRLDWF